MGAIARRRFLADAGALPAAQAAMPALGLAPYRIGLLPEYDGTYLA